MQKFYENMSHEDIENIEQYTSLIYDLRTSRDSLLKQYDATDAASLLEKIRTGAVAEHPAYEHYLSLHILDELRETVRDELKDYLPKVKPE